MFLTNVLLKKAKSKQVMVLLQSTGSNHCIVSFRERLEPKKEIIRRDPDIDTECVYKEIKKIRSMKRDITISRERNEHTYGIIEPAMIVLVALEKHRVNNKNSRRITNNNKN